MKSFNFKSAKTSYSNAVKMNKCEDQWYKKFGSFLIGIVNGRKDFLHSCGVVGLSLVLVSNASFVQAEPAIKALPTGYQSVAGNVEFNQTANTLNVSTGANNSIANYQTFNVGQNATVNFNLPSSQSAILNRVTGGIGSEIFGSINSNGKVFLVNPSGILFGSTAQVNVGSLVTSTLNINNQDFLNKNYNFAQSGNTSAGIVNNGSLVAKDGSVVLLGGAIQNTGNIQAFNGSIQMAVGKSATITMEDGVNVDIQINEALKDKVNGVQTAIANSGSLSANVIKAQTSLNGAIYDQAINNSGLIEATK
jgi:filamentous hemagglutinin family protein